MSIYIKGNKDRIFHPLAEAGQRRCFACNEPLKRVSIHWMGTGGGEQEDFNIYMHPDCCLSICRALLMDCEKFYRTRQKH